MFRGVPFRPLRGTADLVDGEFLLGGLDQVDADMLRETEHVVEHVGHFEGKRSAQVLVVGGFEPDFRVAQPLHDGHELANFFPYANARFFGDLVQMPIACGDEFGQRAPVLRMTLAVSGSAVWWVWWRLLRWEEVGDEGDEFGRTCESLPQSGGAFTAAPFWGLLRTGLL